MRALLDRFRLLRGLGHRAETDRRMAEEMDFHLAQAAEMHERRGLAPDAARRQAALDFGGRDRFVEEARDETRSRLAEETVRDVRGALRTLRRSPGFAAAVVLTLALGVGATTLVYSVIDHVVLRPLPYADAGRLVVVREVVREMAATYPTLPANVGHYLEWKRRCRQCAGMAALTSIGLTFSGEGDPERVGAARVSASLFPLLGARPRLGRLFTDADDQAGNESVIVLADGLWRRRFGADPAIVGRTVTVRDRPYQVVGVLPPDFRLPKGDELGPLIGLAKDVEAYVPLAPSPREITSPGSYDFAVLARLTPEATPARLADELAVVQREIAARAAGRSGQLGVRVVPLQESVVGDARRALLLLLGAVAAVLVVVCVNLATLLLARTTARSRELAVRVALGAGRGRVARHALTEGVVLALVGGGAGVLLAWAGLGALLAAAPADLPRLDEVALDARVLLVMLGVSVAVGLGFGAAPAVRAGRADPGDALKEGGRTFTGRSRGRDALVAVQVALGTVLLVTTGLMLASFVRVLRVDRGFESAHVLALDVVPPSKRYPDEAARVRLYDGLAEALGALPGVTHAAVGGALPLEGETQVYGVHADEAPPAPDGEELQANVRFVSPGYFQALGMTMRAGRAFAERGREDASVVISERTARTLWPGANPLGRRVKVFDGGRPLTVVGVVAEVPTTSLEKEAALLVYAPHWIAGHPRGTLVVRTAGDPALLTAAARAAVRRVDPAVPVPRIRTMSEVVAASVAQRRFQLVVLALFAATALATASVGIYGVVSHSLAQRDREMAVRMALGARPTDIRRLVLGEGMRPVAVGLAAGLALALAAGRSLGALLFDVRAADPAVLLGVVLLLGGVAALACWVPARRAGRVGAGEVLRLG